MEWAQRPVYEEILETLSEGILLLDENLKLVLSNRAAERLLGLEESKPQRLPFDELLSLARKTEGRHPVEQVLKLWYPAARTVKVRATPISSGGTLMTLTDVTEEYLAQRIRREFVAHASHELKSPVAGIQTLASAIQQAMVDDTQTAARFADRLLHEADRLGRLINDLLDLSRLEETAQIPDTTFDLAEVARSVADELKGAAQVKEIDLGATVEEGVIVRGDPQQLRLLLRNLLDNAVRYSHNGGRVRLVVEKQTMSAVIRVSDDGMGIPLESQPRIFERFYRVDKARTRDRGGTGLGLAIVKHVAELYGGSVEVRSEVGRGSIFTARLPLERPHPKREIA